VLPALPADHQNPKYFIGVVNVNVRLLGVGATKNREGVPPTVGESDVVVAPPQTDETPSESVHEPLNVPTATGPSAEQNDPELKVSIVALYVFGGPCTKGGDTYAVMPSPAAACAGRGWLVLIPATVESEPRNAASNSNAATRLIGSVVKGYLGESFSLHRTEP
jgi:hypothetical protein